MPTEEIIADFDSRKEKTQVLTQLGQKKGRLRIEVTPYRPRRSDRQLKWYWPCIVKPFAAWLRDENGEKYSELAAHNILKSEFLKVDVVNKETGVILGSRVKSTGELDTAGFTNYAEDCRNFIAQNCGIVIPDPDPYWNTHTASERAA